MPDVTPIPKKKRKPSRTAAQNKCDELFSKLVRHRDGVCQECGTPFGLQCAHGFSRSYYATRWDFRNAWALCVGCHKKFTHRPLEWEDWMRFRMGDDAYESLRRVAKAGGKPDVFELKVELAERWQQVAA